MAINKKIEQAIYGIYNSQADEQKKVIDRFVAEAEAGKSYNAGNLYGDYKPLYYIAQIIAECKAENRTAAAKSAGTDKRLKAAEAILKNAPEMRIAMKYASIQNGFQYICDGYRLLRFAEPLPVPEKPETVRGEAPDYSRILPNTDGIEMQAPDVIELATRIKDFKAKQPKGKKASSNYPIWDFGADLPKVNAEYLLTMMQALPSAVIKTRNNAGANSNVIFECENGDAGVLCPANYKTIITENIINTRTTEDEKYA